MPSKEQKLKTFQRLGQEHAFSTFLQKKFNTSKRFGIEGCDSMISGLQSLIDAAAGAGAEHVVFGMAHRGRLNTLYNVFQKSAEEIMVEFQDLKSTFNEDIWGNSGDVKYHLGSVHNVLFGDKKLRLEMLPNPSHLETVDPCVYGKVRAIQDYFQDTKREKAFGVVIHGDAAVSGQGIVYESLQMADLEGYKSGGIIHVVSNNQIGFTTVPKDSIVDQQNLIFFPILKKYIYQYLKILKNGDFSKYIKILKSQIFGILVHTEIPIHKHQTKNYSYKNRNELRTII